MIRVNSRNDLVVMMTALHYKYRPGIIYLFIKFIYLFIYLFFIITMICTFVPCMYFVLFILF